MIPLSMEFSNARPRKPATVAALAVLTLFCARAQAQTGTYLGFDRNTYPGDANLKALHQTFSYTGYWLNNPPGERTNTWTGHRAAVESAGFGFLVLFNGRLYAELKSVAYAKKLGNSDAQAATAAARREGFPAHTVIFLDQEQGGRMLPEQKAYLYAWVDAVTAAGFRAGIYCSGMPAQDDGNVVTAEDIRQNAGRRKIVYWAIEDACPPAPGCSFPAHPPSPGQSGVRFAEVWQFAQSPQEKDVAANCSGYNRDGNCYPPGISAPQRLHVDVNSATSPDPSQGRTR
ncbi:MAG: glycoside hydrolase domain-containing protein [Candidatus Sulfotelmatobacter sp.]